MNYKDLGRIAKAEAPGYYDGYTDEDVGRAYAQQHLRDALNDNPSTWFADAKLRGIQKRSTLREARQSEYVDAATGAITRMHNLSTLPERLEAGHEQERLAHERQKAELESQTSAALLKARLDREATRKGLTVEALVRVHEEEMKAEIAFKYKRLESALAYQDAVNRARLELYKEIESKRFEINAAIAVELLERFLQTEELPAAQTAFLQQLVFSLRVGLDGLLQEVDRPRLQAGSEDSNSRAIRKTA